MASNTMEVAALGRPFTLGMLYDARKDQLIPGSTFWDDKTLRENTSESSQQGCELRIYSSESTESKSHLKDVGASLKASFLGGLIEVGGSAKYLNDEKKFKNQSRVTLQYKATTNFKQLSKIDHLNMNTQQTEEIWMGSATHVVTGILYGANAFFVFDSEKLDPSSVQKIESKMEAVIKKIPKFDFKTKSELKLTEEEKDLTEKFSCKFYGDFILETNPSTFEDAVKTYVQLPKLLGENGEKSVPLKVWLMPLKNLYPKAPKLIRQISVGLVSKAEDALEDLIQIGMRCNDSLDDTVVENFLYIKEELSIFQKLCNDYAANLRQDIAKKIPSIREGKENESSAEQLFQERDTSPFSHERLMKWMENKEREINVIRSFVEKMEGIKFVRNQSELDREVLGVEDGLCFVFTSIERGDEYLDLMADYLNAPVLGSTHEDQWFFSVEVLTEMGEKAEAFYDLAKTQKNNSRLCFLITLIANKKYPGASIYHYKNGHLVTDNFSKPELPPLEKIIDRGDFMWYTCDLTLDPNTANNRLTLSLENKMATYGANQTYPDHPDRFDKCPQVLCTESLTGRHYWEVGWSVSSKESVYIGVAYKGIERKTKNSQSRLGCNTKSWCFGKYDSGAIHKLESWQKGNRSVHSRRSTGCNRVGVFLDWPAGTLSYYKVSDELKHLHTFKTKFTEPVYPGFWVETESSHVDLRPAK